MLETLAALYLDYYDGSNQAMFMEDMAEKDEVVLLHHGEEIVGFTTFAQWRRSWKGRPIRIIFSGDTIVSRAHWGQQALAFAWIGRMGKIWCQEQAIPLYWFLIVKGHRTYKYLPTFGKTFHPHWKEPRPDLAELADALARERFGDDYDPVRGVVAFPESRGHLKQEFALPGPDELKKDAVRFFLERNPGYQRGHELACLCEIAPENMKPLARRIFLKGLS